MSAKAIAKVWYGGVSVFVAMLALCATAWGEVEGQPFGIAKFTMQTTGPTKEIPYFGGSVPDEYQFVNEPEAFTQAGGHPWALTATVEFASEEVVQHNGSSTERQLVPTRDPKDVVILLPPGLLGDPLATPRCPLSTVLYGHGARCPASTQVGIYRLKWFGGKEFLGPIVNVVPEPGQSAEFALENSAHVNFLQTAHLIRTPLGYGFDVASDDIPQTELLSDEETFWGVPGDPSHNAMRGLLCGNARRNQPALACQADGNQPSGAAATPFLTMPSDCSAGPVAAALHADSWQEPGTVEDNQHFVGYLEEAAEETLPTTLAGGLSQGFTGCGALSFNTGTEVSVQPNTSRADEPVELGVSLHVPQDETPGGVAAPLLRKTVVTLPEGMSVSPSVVDGIQACNETGPEGINIEGPESERVGANGELQLAPGHCPSASEVGTAEAITPFLPVPVKGRVYLARPGCGNAALGQRECTEEDALDGNLFKLYLELGGEGEDADTGIEFKVPFETEANPTTGQLTAKVSELLQAPYSEVKIHLNGGPRAPLDNPAVCGAALSTADFTPWSGPGEAAGQLFAGTPDALSSSFFNVDLAGDGKATPCPVLPFNPGFVAGTVTSQAGQFSAFTLNISRQDREQDIKGIQIHTPPGLLGLLSSVQLCEEPLADSGHCPESSKIGTTRVASGAGSHPFEIEGKVYLTGPHDGSPFGLSVVTPAVAGPFNLGLVVVRARIDVDPEDSTLTVTTDETGPYALPQILDGVPLRLQRVTVDIDRPGFMFNPTNCGPQQVTANISGSQQAVAGLTSPFAVAGCRSLAFKPSFKGSTSGRTSRADGASLDVKLSYPPGSLGNEADIASVKVELPKQLPARLTTLQKACTAQVFASNPANCPGASIVGVVRASTPILPVGLSGPVYFVSHGGEAFPSLIVVLQGDGVRVDLTGATFISKGGITSSTFKTVPDVPVSTFELYLPEGKYSALTTDGNLCRSAKALKMPTQFVAQNGAVLKQNTQIAVTGCPKANPRKKTKARKSTNGRRRP